MAAATELTQDPQARVLMESLRQARLRDQGATVLAPIMPFSTR
jgi:hypothetical protein